MFICGITALPIFETKQTERIHSSRKRDQLKGIFSIAPDKRGYPQNNFLICAWKSMFWYSLGIPRRGASNEYPQHMFLHINTKILTIFCWKKCLIWSYAAGYFALKYIFSEVTPLSSHNTLALRNKKLMPLWCLWNYSQTCWIGQLFKSATCLKAPALNIPYQFLYDFVPYKSATFTWAPSANKFIPKTQIVLGMTATYYL